MPFDIPEESIFILIFLLISFLNWIGEKVKKAKMASAQRRPQVRGYEEEPPDFPSAPSSQTAPQPSQQEDPMRQILESLGIPTETPPPIPDQPPPPQEAPSTATLWETTEPVEAEPEAERDVENPWALEQLTEEERLAMENFSGGQSEMRHRSQHKTNKEVRKLLAVGHTKTAFVLKEILDKPKCFDA